MNDAKFTLQQTNRERKNLAYQARHKKNGSRSKKCTLPSDHLTPAQKKGLNGTVETYSMNKPHTIKELRQWPEDIRHDYMQLILAKYNPDNTMLGAMLDISKLNVSSILYPVFGIKRERGGKRTRRTAEEITAWENFLGRSMTDSTPAPAEEVVPEDSTEPVVHEDPPCLPEEIKIISAPRYSFFEFVGTIDDLIGLVSKGKAMYGDQPYSISVTLNEYPGHLLDYSAVPLGRPQE